MSAFEYDESELPEVVHDGETAQAGEWSFWLGDEGPVEDTRLAVLSWIAFYEWRVANGK